MQLLISNEQSEVPVGEEMYTLLSDALREVLATEPFGPVKAAINEASVEVSMVLVDDARMAALNEQYRGVAGATDVLAFPMLEPAGSEDNQAAAADSGALPGPEAEFLLGDIVISVPRALSQAAACGNSLLQEMVVLSVHGMLHLIGYDHVTAADAARMRERARQALAGLGLESGTDV